MANASPPPPASPGLTPLFAGLYATGPAPLPFLQGVDVRSYVLAAQQGVVIVYNSPGIDAAAARIRQLGPPTRLLVNHYHEGMYGQPNLDVPVYVHKRDRAGLARSMQVAGVFTGRETIGEDLEVVPSLSHTAGTTFFLWDNGEHRFLFPGDAIWVEDGVWKAVILPESNRQAFLDTLALMRDLNFDVLMPWHAYRDGRPYDLVTPQQKRAQIDTLAARIAAGGSGVHV